MCLKNDGTGEYDPTENRWTQQDPFNQPSDLKQADRYSYAGDDPINRTDPTGRCDFPLGCLSDAANFVGNYAGQLWSLGETASYTLAAGAIATFGTAACVDGGGGPACGAIAATAGSAAVAGAYDTYEEAQNLGGP